MQLFAAGGLQKPMLLHVTGVEPAIGQAVPGVHVCVQIVRLSPLNNLQFIDMHSLDVVDAVVHGS